MFIFNNKLKRLISMLMAIMILFTSTGGFATVSALTVAEEIETHQDETISISVSLDSLQSAGRNIERFTVEFAERKIQEKTGEEPVDKSKIVTYDTSAIAKEALKYVGLGGSKFCRWYGVSSGTPWCAIFAYYCVKQANYPITKSASVRGLANYYKAINMYIDDNNYIPKAGDLIFYNFKGRGHDYTHVGIVEKYENGTVYTIEGNWGGHGNSYISKVSKSSINLKSNEISGYGLND